MYTGQQNADQAKNPAYDKIKYSQCDCQAFVELVLKDLGVRSGSGAVYNWRGSNHMWRDALSWKGTKEEAIAKYGSIPVGCWVFMVKHDGGEIPRGYHDNEGNASHVGIYIGNDQTRDSTKGTNRDGVGTRPLKDWTHIGLPKCLDFSNTSHNIIEIDADSVTDLYTVLQSAIKIIGGWVGK